MTTKDKYKIFLDNFYVKICKINILLIFFYFKKMINQYASTWDLYQKYVPAMNSSDVKQNEPNMFSPNSVLVVPTPTEISEYVFHSFVKDKRKVGGQRVLAELIAEEYEKSFNSLSNIPVIDNKGIHSLVRKTDKFSIRNEEDWRPYIVLTDRNTDSSNEITISSTIDIGQLKLSASDTVEDLTFKSTSNVLNTSIKSVSQAPTSVPLAKYSPGVGSVRDWIEALLSLPAAGDNAVLVPLNVDLSTPITTAALKPILFVGRYSNTVLYTKVVLQQTTDENEFITFPQVDPQEPIDYNGKIQFIFNELSIGSRWNDIGLIQSIVESLNRDNDVVLSNDLFLNSTGTFDFIQVDSADTVEFNAQSAQNRCLIFKNGTVKGKDNSFVFPSDKVEVRSETPLHLDINITNAKTNISWRQVRQKIQNLYKLKTNITDSFYVDMIVGDQKYITNELNQDNPRLKFIVDGQNLIETQDEIFSHEDDNIQTTGFYVTVSVTGSEGSSRIIDNVMHVIVPGGYHNVGDVVDYLNQTFSKNGFNTKETDGIYAKVNATSDEDKPWEGKVYTYIFQNLYITCRYINNNSQVIKYFDKFLHFETIEKMLKDIQRYLTFVSIIFGTEYYYGFELNNLLRKTSNTRTSTFKQFIRYSDVGFGFDVLGVDIFSQWNKINPQTSVDISTILSDSIEVLQLNENKDVSQLIKSLTMSQDGQDIFSMNNPVIDLILSEYKVAVSTDLLINGNVKSSLYSELLTTAWNLLESVISIDSSNTWYDYIRKTSLRKHCLTESIVQSILLDALIFVYNSPTTETITLYKQYMKIYLEARRELVTKIMIKEKY